MEKKMLAQYLKYAIENNSIVKIKTINNKEFKAYIDEYENRMLYIRFENNNEPGRIWFDNIVNVKFKESEDEKNFRYKLLSEKYDTKDLEKIIENFEKYYLEIIELLLKIEKENPKGENNLKNKKRVYPQIFKNIIKDENNLLFYYFTQKKPVSNELYTKQKEILLIEQANLSQKEAINNALNERISIIEGPPGTGKTTTIINILANLIYQNKKVLVVSKNNSAIENIAEELSEMNIPKCFIRMGNSSIMKENLEPNIEKILMEYTKQINKIQDNKISYNEEELIKIIEEINQKEKKLNLLIEKRNELQELENQLRHIKKKSEAYNVNKYRDILGKRYQNLNDDTLKKRINQLAKILILLDEKKKIGIWKQIITWFVFRKNNSELEEEGILIHLLLEEFYITNLIEKIKKEFEIQDFEKLKINIKELYTKEYIPISRNILKKKICENFNKELVLKIFEEMKDIPEATEEKPTPRLNACKNELLELYPIVLTTVDSVISNYDSYFRNGKMVDYIIIDESSQCDILSALPLLYLAKNIIIVGDKKQLSAITNLQENLMKNTVDNKYSYTQENFLSTISKTINPPRKMLLEHYRCDYNIINYCNKFFYGGKLKIYKDAKKGAMSLVNNDKGKYVEKSEDGYKNEREIKTIDKLIDSNIENNFIITPFRLQADTLRKKYGEERCGTIHTFQGKGEKNVYFSSVLNNTKECVSHLQSDNNLFTNELVNVAVSRAKEKFTLVTDIDFFKKHDKNMKNLIEYIEIYGEEIPDKTVCIFDYLYREMPSYQQLIKNIDNPFEEKIFYLLKNYLKNKKQYKMVYKLPLAEFVTDKKFLSKNKELKDFIQRNSHLDFAIYSNTINKPILGIEVDGKYHLEEEQKINDRKKEEILKYMEIPLLRIPSKVAWSEEELKEEIEKKILQ